MTCSIPLFATLLAVLGPAASAAPAPAAAGAKVAVIVVQDPAAPRAIARFAAAAEYALMFKRAGASVELLFDREGVRWLASPDEVRTKAAAAPAPAPLPAPTAPPPVLPSSPEALEKLKAPRVPAPSAAKAPSGAGRLPPWEATPAEAERVEKAFADLAAEGMTPRASGRAADRLELRGKLKRKPKFVNESGAAEELPRLLAQGYQLLVF
jgi:hypothetical protein